MPGSVKALPKMVPSLTPHPVWGSIGDQLHTFWRSMVVNFWLDSSASGKGWGGGGG